ncbi:hypothetical protein [Paludibaculum fermentans]|uniref:hypothetical protein n=1 Tax=Paludibaculum fermentans TaxID=1473598 RepID=UPI003EBD08D4
MIELDAELKSTFAGEVVTALDRVFDYLPGMTPVHRLEVKGVVVRMRPKQDCPLLVVRVLRQIAGRRLPAGPGPGATALSQAGSRS